MKYTSKSTSDFAIGDKVKYLQYYKSLDERIITEVLTGRVVSIHPQKFFVCAGGTVYHHVHINSVLD